MSSEPTGLYTVAFDSLVFVAIVGLFPSVSPANWCEDNSDLTRDVVKELMNDNLLNYSVKAIYIGEESGSMMLVGIVKNWGLFVSLALSSFGEIHNAMYVLFSKFIISWLLLELLGSYVFDAFVEMVGLSIGEKHFIEGGIAQDLRTDGRKRWDYRLLSIETGVIPQASGSARVRMGGTDVIASVTAELGKPNHLHPDKGKVSIFVDCSPTAAPMSEGRGGEELDEYPYPGIEKAWMSIHIYSYWFSVAMDTGRPASRLIVNRFICDCDTHVRGHEMELVKCLND
ncbi:hypothetical protein GIB67_042981 [Kingdonia uniflora]|uniref:Ribosomal RNA-processing protein 42 n=1 Tax=Kingdonia uniflora TaxID=39325 RepID=A0A7J7NSY7_9MAGN|nr:hypothetical protein GIB67_042981 [Kingdonia uniflora]